MILKLLTFMGTNEVVLGISSIAGIIGFVLTILVSIRTEKITKILKYNQITSQYNKERAGYKKAFQGHIESIINDGIQTDAILKNILQNVEEYRLKYGEILSIKEKITLFFFIRQLKKKASDVDFNKIANYLAKLSGRLSKKEEKKHG